MPKVAEAMKPIEVGRLKEPGRHPVGGVAGLALQVTGSGARTWVLRVMVGSKRREIGLGAYPGVTLADARRKAAAAREQIAQGLDPVEQRRAAQSSLRAAQMKDMTFKQCALAYIEAHESGWRNAKHGQQWRNTLEAYAYPVIGSMQVRDVDMAHVLKVLEPIWREKTETASRLRGRIESVLDWAKGRKLRDGDNPAAWKGNLDAQLPRPEKIAKVEHHAALPIDAMGAFMHRLRAAEGNGARALEFAILTAGRSGEVRGATWAEVDIEGKTWTVPAARMKAGREHRVPLSDAAVTLLKAQTKLAGTDLIFPAPRGGELSDMTLTQVLRRMKVPAVPHGFRSTFRDWVSERTSFPGDMAEMALAHTIGNQVEAAYRRGDMLAKRYKMMNAWAEFIARPAVKGKVIDLAAARGAA